MKTPKIPIGARQKMGEATYVVGRPPGPGVAGYTFLVNVAHDSPLDGLFVPSQVGEQILQDQVRKDIAKSEEESRAKLDEESTVPRTSGSTIQGARPLTMPSASLHTKLLRYRDEDPVPEHHFRVWQPSAVRERVVRHDARITADRELRARDESILAQLIQQGPDRPLLQLSAVESALQRLEADFPNFRPIVQLVAGGLASGQRIPPILLVGRPGIGKTYFCNRLAEALTVPFELVSVASGANSSFLCGVGRNWANSEVGAVARLLALKPNAYANSMLLVDEIDKEPRERNNYESPRIS